MSKKLRTKIGITSLGMLTAFLLLSGCAALRLHDESKAMVAAGVKEKYTQADVLSVIDVEKKNLDNLLAEELKVVRDNHQLQVDFALLSIADDNTPMAETYTQEATERLKELGFPNSFKQARVSRLENTDLASGQAKMQLWASAIERLTREIPPPCRLDGQLPDTMSFHEPLPTDKKARAENYYRHYRKICVKLQDDKKKEPAPGGQIKQALGEWNDAKEQLSAKDRSIADAKKQLQEAQDAYNRAVEAVNEAKGSGPQLEEDLRSKAASLSEKLENTKSADPGIVPEERLHAIITLLTAAAGGKIDTTDPDVKKAAIIAKEIPSLAGDIKGLLEQAKAPSVNNLLIEMRHQIVLLEYAKQLRTLAQQRVDILKAKYDALTEETGYWLKFGDAICSYAVLSAGKLFPGDRCDDFAIEPDGKLCKLDDTSDGQISDCASGKPWNVNLKATANPAATRELYKALANYLQALVIQARPYEQDFRLIDVWHRETLAARQFAIQGWDNLVAVPVNQLDAYYQAGLKPAEIADLIVKALGFTAIAIGVSQ